MDCNVLEQMVAGRLLAELEPVERSAVAAHVAQCEACRERYGLDE